MSYLDWPHVNYNNNAPQTVQDLALDDSLRLLDSDTAYLIGQKINSHDNKISLGEWTVRIHNALAFVDRGMLQARQAEIKNTAKSISTIISELIKSTDCIDPDALITRFYAENNSSLQAPIIRVSQDKNKAKQLSNISDEQWWANKLRDTLDQNREHLRKLIGLVNPVTPYASDSAVKNWKISNHFKNKFLDSKTIIIKETGEIVRLRAIAKTEDQEYAEMWCILRGLDGYAQVNNMPSAMVTISAPAKYHASPSNLTSLTTVDAQEFIVKKWHDVSKLLHRYKNRVFAFRVVEANVDGTPHWHVLLYFQSDIKIRLQTKLMRAFAVDNLDNPVLKWQDTDRDIGTFLSYVTKSIIPSTYRTFNKAMSGQNERIDAFRATWNMRSCQFIGLPKGYLNAWRAAKRVNPSCCKDKNAADLLRNIKKNNFQSFLSAYIAGNIILSKPVAGRAGDVIIFGEQLNKQKESACNNVKVNIISNLNNSNNLTSYRKSAKNQQSPIQLVKHFLKNVLSIVYFSCKAMLKTLTITPTKQQNSSKEDLS